MAPAKTTMLSTLLDTSENEQSDIDMMPTPDSQPENKAPPKRKEGRAKATVAANKAAKTKVVSRRVSDPKAVKAKARKVLAERTVAPNEDGEGDVDGNETEEVDDFDEVALKPAKRGKAAKMAKEDASATAKSRARAAPAPKRAGRPKHASPEVLPSDGTRAEPMEIEATEVHDDTIVELPPARKRRPVSRPPLAPQLSSRAPLASQMSSRARSSSRQPEPFSRHRQGGSASDTERAGEPALRRKLGDVTRRFENLDLKYRNLKELGSSDSQSNFDKLKKATDQKARDQDEIIASLKKELASQKALSVEARSLRTQHATLQAENQHLSSDNKAHSSTITSLQTEVKTLQTKLAAARSKTVSDRTVPGSAVKARGPAAKAQAENENERARILQMKEDLYSDLTGLMIHNVKRTEEEDIFDCIQTGRNGTLRFHLSVSRPSTTATISTPGTTYDEEEFAYAPMFDEKNDQALLEILPDYLTEEIVFPRPSAARFYQKLGDCMSRKVIDEE